MTDPTINTLEAPGEFDALPKLRPGEPYFALLGRDASAPPLVLTWAHFNRQRALKLPEGEKRDHELKQSLQAEEIAWAMDDYREGVIAAEEPVVEQKGYTGFQLDDATIERDRQIKARVSAASIVSRAYSELTDEADVIERNDPHLAQAIRYQIETLRQFHDYVSVKRPILDTDPELPMGDDQ